MASEPDKIRERARVALEANWTSSVKASTSAFTILGVITGVIASAVVGLKVASPLPTIAALIAGVLFLWVGIVLAAEMERLRMCRVRLEELVDNDKFYEQLLDETRREREQLRQEVAQVRADATVQLQLVEGRLQQLAQQKAGPNS